jgi:hypothetical protein
MVYAVNATFDDSRRRTLIAWKEDVEDRVGQSLSWSELLLLYASDKKMRPERA